MFVTAIDFLLGRVGATTNFFLRLSAVQSHYWRTKI